MLFLFIIQLLIFVIAILALLFTLWHLFQLYLIQVKNAFIDPLIGIYNRRAILWGLRREMRKSERYKRPTTVAMLDIDYFKKYNDTNGHVKGDQLLKRLGKIMTKAMREYDFVGRYGGEEFLIILPETNLSTAKKIIERLRLTIEKTAFAGRQNMPHKRVTVSIGLAEHTGEKRIKKEALIDIADQRLYNAKESGRNQIIFKGRYKKQ